MKISRILLFFGFSLLILVSCSKIEEDPFPSLQEAEGSHSGDIIWKTGVFSIDEKQYKADFGIFTVSENRDKYDSRLIHLPVVRIHAAGESPSEPVFLLAGGPGMTNIWGSPPVWLLENHDVVMGNSHGKVRLTK